MDNAQLNYLYDKIFYTQFYEIIIFSSILTLLFLLFLILTKKNHINYTGDNLKGVQKIHNDFIPRIGGLGIFLSLIMTIIVVFTIGIELRYIETTNLIIMSCFPCLFVGVLEDFTKNISPFQRLLGTFLSGLLGFLLTGYFINEINIPVIDQLLSNKFIALFFTCLAVAALSNSINIIDGLNGLSSGSIIISLILIAFVASFVKDQQILYSSIFFIIPIIIFFFFNWPFPKVFLGDGGSYFYGGILAWLIIILENRNAELNYVLLFLCVLFPAWEIAFTVLRRFLLKQNIFRPDLLHFHSLFNKYIQKKLINSNFKKYSNSISSSIILFLFAIFYVFLFINYFDYFFVSNSVVFCCIIFYILFYSLVYVFIYKKSVNSL